MQKKKLMVVGGMGYVGNRLVKMASKVSNWTVYSVQRSDVPENLKLDNVEYIKGDAMHPEQFIDKIKQCSAIVHTIGTLVDSVVLRKSQVGGPGSYEQMNFETAKRMGDAFNSFKEDKNKNFVYISANHAPPFLPRYLENKIKAENYLKDLENFNFYSVRPGVVTSNERIVTVPLGYAVDALHFLQQNPPLKQMMNMKYIGCLLKQFEVDKSVNRDLLCKAILYLAMSDSKNKKQINVDQDIYNAQESFDHQIIN